jgi:HEAT repeat protein
MRPLARSLLLLAVAASARADDAKEPVINGKTVAGWVKQLQTAESPDDRSAAAFALAQGKEKSKPAVPALAAALKDRNKTVRANVATALGVIGPAAAEAVPALVAALKGPDAETASAAAMALGGVGEAAKDAVPPLTAVVKDARQAAEVRRAAAYGLGGIGPAAKSAAPVLTAALKDADARVRVKSAVALFKVDKETAATAVPVLRAALAGKDELARLEAVYGLKAFGPAAKEAVPELIAALKAGGKVATYAGEALSRVGEPAAAALVEAAKGPDEGLKKAAIAVLKEYYPDAAKKAGIP